MASLVDMKSKDRAHKEIDKRVKEALERGGAGGSALASLMKSTMPRSEV